MPVILEILSRNLLSCHPEGSWLSRCEGQTELRDPHFRQGIFNDKGPSTPLRMTTHGGDGLIVTLNDIREAQARLRGVAVRTELIPSHIHETDSSNDHRTFTSSQRIGSPSALSNCGGLTTRSLRFRTKSGAAG